MKMGDLGIQICICFLVSQEVCQRVLLLILHLYANAFLGLIQIISGIK